MLFSPFKKQKSCITLSGITKQSTSFPITSTRVIFEHAYRGVAKLEDTVSKVVVLSCFCFSHHQLSKVRKEISSVKMSVSSDSWYRRGQTISKGRKTTAGNALNSCGSLGNYMSLRAGMSALSLRNPARRNIVKNLPREHVTEVTPIIPP